MSAELEWLAAWFRSERDVSTADFDKHADSNYFDAAWVDSIHFIQLIADAEDHFGIRFSNDEFQDRTFATPRGLASIIAGKANA